MYCSIGTLFEFSFSYKSSWYIAKFSWDRSCLWSKKGLSLSQRKYHTDLFDLLKEIFMLRIQTHYSNIRFDQHLGKPLVDPGQNTDWLVMVHLMVAQPNSPFLSVC